MVESQGGVLVMASPDVPGMTRLKAAEREVVEIGNTFHVAPLVGSRATKAELFRLAPTSRIVHLAAHARIELGAPGLSRIYLADSATLDTSLTIVDIGRLQLNGSLVVLSACDTERGTITGGDEIIALGRAFLTSGAREVVSSLWKVEDETTRALMSAFYAQISKGIPTGDALRRAQVDTRKAYPHPYHWAAFVANVRHLR